MRAIFGLVLVLGMGLAGLAVYMVKNNFAAQEQQLAAVRAQSQTAVPTIDVYAVNRAIAYGEPLTPEDVVVIKHAEAFLPEGAFLTQEELFPQGTNVHRVVLRAMEPNEPILAVKVTDPGKPAGITSRLSEGMRAVAIEVDAASGVSGFLRPGDRVDVYWTGTINSADRIGGREITRLIESSIEIIAVDQSADASASGIEIARTVTVQVSPQDVADLTQAQSTGKLSLSLVGKGDETISSAIEVDQNTLLNIAEAPILVEEAPPEPEQTCMRRERRGIEVVEIPIPCSE